MLCAPPGLNANLLSRQGPLPRLAEVCPPAPRYLRFRQPLYRTTAAVAPAARVAGLAQSPKPR